MASQLKVDTITGVTTAGSISVTGEGNSTTTNLQQSLVKVWAKFNGSSFGELDSFNVSSFTDSGTGNYTVNINNDFSNANHASIEGSGAYHTVNDAGNFAIRTTASYQTQCWATNGAADALRNDSTIFGDLA